MHCFYVTYGFKIHILENFQNVLHFPPYFVTQIFLTTNETPLFVIAKDNSKLSQLYFGKITF